MTEFSIRDFFDLEAEVVHDDEEEEEEDEELAEFFDDNIEESEVDWPRATSVASSNDDADALRASAAARRVTRSSMPEVPQHLLLPAQGDPELWAVRVKPEFEKELVFALARRCLQDGLPSLRPTIASAFFRPGIPGYIFIEGQPSDVFAAVQGLVAVYRERWLVPPEERATLLSPRNPLSRNINDGEWVRCRHGLYRGDIGLVCEHDPIFEAELLVAFIPRIRNKPSGFDRKRQISVRPDPQKWSIQQAKAVWGDKVKRISDDEYELKNETYRSGLILKRLSPASIDISSAPYDVEPFFTAPFILTSQIFSSVGIRYAQDTIKIGDRVKVLEGEQQGLVGHTVDINDGKAAVVFDTNGDIPPLLISLHSLSNSFVCGDHVKHRFANKRGIVLGVREEVKSLTFVPYGTGEHVITHIHFVESTSPPEDFYRFVSGLWVHFNGPNDTLRPKRRGVILKVEDAHAIVIDECTFTQFRINTCELEVSRSQAPSLPSADLVHPWVGKRVVVIKGPRRGYFGVVRFVGNTSVTVDLDALFTGSVAPQQEFVWHHLKPVSKEEEAARYIPVPRSRTPPFEPEAGPPRALTPEPEGSHWLFKPPIQYITERNNIPFYIRNLHEASAELQQYAKCTGRTVPVDSRKLNPKDGEVVLSVFVRSRHKQLSIHPKFIEPWPPVRNGKVVVTTSTSQWFGTIGGVREQTDEGRWQVRFTHDNLQYDHVFEGDDLAAVQELTVF